MRTVARSLIVLLGVGGTFLLAAPVAAQDPLPSWMQGSAISLPQVDGTYQELAYGSLRGLIGDARILALGEPVHGGHEPLAFRNQLIRYAVSKLGFTAVALESGLTEGMIADDFVLGGPGDIDSVVRHGFTWDFQYLPENRELLRWLREYNARAPRKVHFYGIDLTGADDVGAYPRAAGAVRAALADLESMLPGAAADHSGRLLPLMDRFLPKRYAEYSPAERERLRVALDSLYQGLQSASQRTQPADARRSARGVRNAWMALRLNEVMSVFGPEGSIAGAVLRDSIMAENTRWALQLEGENGRLLLFAHDAHVMNARFVVPTPPYAGSWKAQGMYLRAWFGSRLVTIGSAMGTLAGKVNGETGWVQADADTPTGPATFSAQLAKVGRPLFVLDLRTGDGTPAVRAALQRSWPFEFLIGAQPLSPRQTFDAMVYFDHVTATQRLR